jgi:hypothetical protein
MSINLPKKIEGRINISKKQISCTIEARSVGHDGTAGLFMETKKLTLTAEPALQLSYQPPGLFFTIECLY